MNNAFIRAAFWMLNGLVGAIYFWPYPKALNETLWMFTAYFIVPGEPIFKLVNSRFFFEVFSLYGMFIERAIILALVWYLIGIISEKFFITQFKWKAVGYLCFFFTYLAGCTIWAVLTNHG